MQPDNGFLSEIQFVVGKGEIFFAGYCVLLLIKALIISLMLIAVYYYFAARARIKAMIADFEKSKTNVELGFKQPKMREKLLSLIFVAMQLAASTLLLIRFIQALLGN